jgi:hypothetical protein
MFKDNANTLPAVRRINVTEMYEVRQWADRYGCTPKELRDAVRSVGNVADDVQRHLAAAKPAPVSGRAALEAAFAPSPR